MRPSLRTTALVGCAVAVGMAGIVVEAAYGKRIPAAGGVAQPQLWALVGLLPLLATGAALSLWRPAERVPRLLLATATAMAVASGLGALTSRLYSADPHRTWVWLLVYAEYHFDLAGPAAMGAMFMLFPDGKPGRRYERRVLVGFGVLVAAVPTLVVVTSHRLAHAGYVSLPPKVLVSPLYVPALGGLGRIAARPQKAGEAMAVVGGLLLAVRYRRLSRAARLQTLWPLLAALIVAGDIVVVQYLGAFGVLPHSAQTTAFYAAWLPALLCIPAAIGIALVRYELFDVRLVIRRSLVYGLLSVVVAGVYLAAAAGAGIAAGQRAPLAVAVGVTLAAAALFAPLRRRLDAWADRFAFGDRVSGYDLLTEFGATLGHAYDLSELAPQMAATLVRGLGLSWARVSLVLPGGGAVEPLGAVGIALEGPGEPALVETIADAGDELGRIECGPAAKRDLGAVDEVVVATLATQAALAVRNSQLTAELAARLDETRRQAAELDASRQRIVAAADVERRRIERNIHDGAQQQLAALLAKLRLARSQLARDPSVVEATLAEAQAEAYQSMEDLRELARGIHPPVLSDHGLLAAIDARVARMPIVVAIEAGPELTGARYPPEVEAVAYFLVCEALANVLKHAEAQHIQVMLRYDGTLLHVEVADDGTGFVPADTTGSGLTGLVDRVEAAGGTLAILSRPGYGTRLLAQLPVRGRKLSNV